MSTTETRTVTGNVVADPELRRTPDGTPVTDLRIAVNTRAKTSEGEWVDAGTDYYTVTTWRTEAENAAESLRKGARITVTPPGHVLVPRHRAAGYRPLAPRTRATKGSLDTTG